MCTVLKWDLRELVEVWLVFNFPCSMLFLIIIIIICGAGKLCVSYLFSLSFAPY